MLTPFKSISIIVIALILSACTFTQPAKKNMVYINNNDVTWQNHLSQIKQIKSYSATGQFGYIGGKERFSSRFDWQYQDAMNYKLKIYSNLSSKSLLITMENGNFVIADNKGQRHSEQDGRQLLREIIGGDIPLQQLSLWLKGQPNEPADYKVGENRLLASFDYPVNHILWTVDYLDYYTQLSPVLPKDISLANGEQTLKIRIDEWKH